MPESTHPPLVALGAGLGVSIPNRFSTDRSSAFSYATLRRITDESRLASMSKQKPRAKGDEATPAGLSLPSAFFLRPKLLPPRPAPEILARHRLIERLPERLRLPVPL